MRLIDLAGQRFGRLMVLGIVKPNTTRNVRWMCQCDCGKSLPVLTDSLRQGRTKSCGCLWKEWSAAQVTSPEHQKQRVKNWQRQNAKKCYEAVRRWIRANPKKSHAHNIVKRAIKYGKLTRKPCEVCGKERTHAHHSDYEKPLDVTWLCVLHHVAQHRWNATHRK